MNIQHCVTVKKIEGNLRDTIRQALAECGILSRLSDTDRIALKPNLTYPYYKKGVTTSPAVIREVVHILSEYTPHIAIVETDGGYGAWAATEAFEGHGLYDLRDTYGVEVVNLCDEPRELITFKSRGRTHSLPLPTRLLYETDLFISMPVPKIHCMTGLSLGFKNQWGCIPDIMRLRMHHIFHDAIVEINRALKPVILSDGSFFLDQQGPMAGDPVEMNLIIAATDAGAFDLYLSELMGISWKRIKHLCKAVKSGQMPKSLEEIQYNIHPRQVSNHKFVLQRTLQNWIALAGFYSRFLTWLGYESWFGRVVIHAILYAIAGKPVKPAPETES